MNEQARNFPSVPLVSSVDQQNGTDRLEQHMHRRMLELALALCEKSGGKSLLQLFGSSLIQTMMEHPLEEDEGLVFALDYTVNLLLKDTQDPMSKFLRVDPSRREGIVLKTIQKDFLYGLEIYRHTQEGLARLARARGTMPDFLGASPVDQHTFWDEDAFDEVEARRQHLATTFSIQQGDYGVQGDLFETGEFEERQDIP